MFLISLAWGVVELVLVGGTGLFLFQDYKRGFVATKGLAEKAGSKFRQLTGIRESEVDKANRAVEQRARQVAILRESVASLKANYQLAEKRHHEEMILVSQFNKVEEQALRANDQDAATAAAIAKIQAERRVQRFADHAQDQIQVARVLEQELEGQEFELDISRTQAEDVRLNNEISEAQRNLYELTSNIQAQTGFTARGVLEQALINTEREKLKTSALLEMASKHSLGRVSRFMELAEVKQELDEARKRIALPPAPSEVEHPALPETTEDRREDSQPVEAEIVM